MDETENFELAMQVVERGLEFTIHNEEALEEEEQQFLQRVRKEQGRIRCNKGNADMELKKACVSASKAWCWPFTCMLIDKLPRELCDMILDHLLEYEREQIVLSVHHVNKWNVDEGHPMRCVKPLFEGLYQPYFAYPYCVHEKFALEAAEALYRVALVRVVDYKQLEKHLHRDVFSTACLPSDHIRRVEIEMTFPEGSYHRIPHKLEYTKFVGLTAPPFKIKHLKDLQIRLVIARFWATSTQSSFIKLEEVLAPTIHQLHHSGTKVIWFSRDDEFEPLYAIDRLTLNRDYTQSMEDMMDGITANSVSDAHGY